jgi:hypothetical protein
LWGQKPDCDGLREVNEMYEMETISICPLFEKMLIQERMTGHSLSIVLSKLEYVPSRKDVGKERENKYTNERKVNYKFIMQ